MADIGIMGGTFDPIHLAHLLIAERAYEILQLDKVLFLTSGNPPHKTKRKITDKSLREKMVQAAIADNEHFEICDYETNRKEYSYTAQTLEYLKDKKPEDNFFFILGEDSLDYLDKWYRPDIIVSIATIVVYGRGQNSDVFSEIKRIKKELNAKIIHLDAPLFDISSTSIRNAVADGESIKYMVPDNVIDIIKKENLYFREEL